MLARAVQGTRCAATAPATTTAGGGSGSKNAVTPGMHPCAQTK